MKYQGEETMKWTRKGHQFDEAAEIICNKNTEYYIWGAGETGNRFLEKNKNLFKIKGIIDSNKDLIGERIEDFEIVSPDILDKEKNIKIIITVFSPACIEEITERLEIYDKRLNVDYFYFTLFERVYNFYSENKLKLAQTDIMITNICTLSCEKCLLQMPLIKKKKMYNLEELKINIDKFFKYVDYVDELHIVGGEPLIHNKIIDFIMYINDNYSDRFHEMDIVSNATIVPSQELLKILKKYNITFIISNYSLSEVFNERQEIITIKKLLSENSINLKIREQKEWFDFQGNYVQGKLATKGKLKSLFDLCPCVGKTITIQNEKIYLCCRQAAAINGGLFSDASYDYLDINNSYDDMKKLLLEFSLCCTLNGFLEYCKTCYDVKHIYKRIVPAAKQLR